jgi:4-hydroxy-L-threonine phosphate dehydrogenase PdxA
MTIKPSDDRPIIALAMGDPAGIGAELTAKLLASDDVRAAAHLIVVGDRRVLDAGARVAGVQPDFDQAAPDTLASGRALKPVLVDLANLDPADVSTGVATLAGGRFATQNFAFALKLADRGQADAVCFTPFNKIAMRYAYPGYYDEIRFISEIIGFTGRAREFNVLEAVWNARVTSHMPLAEVSRSLSKDAILGELALTFDCLRRAGVDAPKIAVAGFNPHAGDGGNFGREEIEIISPAVEEAARRGWDVNGPYPADTVFLSAIKGGFHAVLTMYHDQGQIAMKTMGFDRGVTMLGGLPFPVCTPAHGTAYDIAGKGIANSRASQEALLLAARMARRGNRPPLAP